MKDRQILSRAGSVRQQSKSIHLGHLLVTPESVPAFWSDGLSSAAPARGESPPLLGSEFRVLAFRGGDEVGIISSYLTSS